MSTLVQIVPWCDCQLVINHANVDPDLCRHRASLGHSELIVSCAIIKLSLWFCEMFILGYLLCVVIVFYGSKLIAIIGTADDCPKKQITAEQFANYFSPTFKQARVDKKRYTECQYNIANEYNNAIVQKYNFPVSPYVHDQSLWHWRTLTSSRYSICYTSTGN